MKAEFLAPFLVVTLLSGGCGGAPAPEGGAPDKTNALVSHGGLDDRMVALGQTGNVSPSMVPGARNRFVDDLHRQLQRCDQELSEVGRKMESWNVEARVEGAKAVESWRVQRAQLRQKLDKIKMSGQEAGQDIKAGCESAAAELEKAFEKLKTRFKE